MFPDPYFRSHPLQRLVKEMDRFLDHSFQQLHSATMDKSVRHKETDEAYHLFFTFPKHINKEQIEVRIHPSYIRITASHREQTSRQDELKQLYSYSEGMQLFEQRIPLPPQINPALIKTYFEHQQLHIVIPKNHVQPRLKESSKFESQIE